MKSKYCASPDLSTWIDTNRNQFVSHAIWSCNVNTLLSSGFVCPAESILRHPPYSVEFEAGTYGERGTLDLSESIKQLSSVSTNLPSQYTIVNFIEIDNLSEYGLLTEEVCALAKTNYECGTRTIQLKDGKFYPIKHSEALDSLILEGIPSIIRSDYFDMEDALAKFNNISQPYGRIKLIQEIIAGSNIFDKKLAEIWDTHIPLQLETTSRVNLSHFLNQVRQQQFGLTKLNASIRCAYNSIAWSYGNVVVLRGKPSTVISSTNNHKRLTNTHSYCYKPLVDKQEVILLFPWENHGEYYSLDLSQEDTLIIGPEKALSPYQNKNYKLYSFEKMTLSQLDFFQVPQRLRPKIDMPIFFSLENKNACPNELGGEINPSTSANSTESGEQFQGLAINISL